MEYFIDWDQVDVATPAADLNKLQRVAQGCFYSFFSVCGLVAPAFFHDL